MQLSHAFSRFSVCSCDFLAQYSMNPYVYPTGRRRMGFGTSYGLSCRPVWGKYRACRTHACMGAFWTTHDSPWAQNRRKPISESCTCLSFSHGLYGTRTGKKIIENRTNPQCGHPPSLMRAFAMRLIGKQGHKASSYEHRSLIN